MNFYEQLFSRGRTTGEGMTHFERLFAAKFGGSPPPEVREYTGIVPVTIMADGTPLLDYLITGNTTQSGTPTPSNPVPVVGVGELETTGEHSGEYKIPISSANTTTPVYLGEVETERKIRKLVLTGDENWHVEGNDIFYTEPITDALRYAPICSHFKGTYTFSGNNQVAVSHSLRINIKTNNITHTVSDFKTYLAQQYAAGTPVTVWYVLATPTTGIVNEPLMRIGDYADTLSKAQAGVTIPTNNGSNTFDVDTTVKPSEVYLKYMG